MSDVMLFGVLRMPYELAMSDELSRRQFYRRAQEAADKIERLARIVAIQRVVIKQCAEPPHNVPEAGSAMQSYLGQDTEAVEAALAASPVPAEIMAIADRLRTQDNRITDNPLFAVQQKREYVGSENYNDAEAKWVDDDGREADDDETSRLDAEYAQTYAEPEGWRRVHVFHVWEFVTGCLTEQGCKDYIARNGHNLREPRIYAYGSYRNAEWIALRKWLMSLPAAPTMLNGLTESAASVSAPAQQNKTALMPEEEAALKRALHRSVTLLPAAPAPSVEAQAADSRRLNLLIRWWFGEDKTLKALDLRQALCREELIEMLDAAPGMAPHRVVAVHTAPAPSVEAQAAEPPPMTFQEHQRAWIECKQIEDHRRVSLIDRIEAVINARDEQWRAALKEPQR